MNAASNDSNHVSSRSSIVFIPVLILSGIVIVIVFCFQFSVAGSILTSVPYLSSGMLSPSFLFTTA